ncbi:MAG: hypothetical protein RMI45_00510 [Ignisphaera sp.]|nr:hypothetical protein [Ignisphaera sp.]MDW8084707.1 hypothetical protein [Ignisphaera sp.]
MLPWDIAMAISMYFIAIAISILYYFLRKGDPDPYDESGEE